MSKDNEKKHPVLKAVTITAVAGASAYAGYAYYLFRQAFDFQRSTFAMDRSLNMDRETMKKGLQWLSESDHEEATITSFDGLRLHGTLITNHKDSHKWVIFHHGYHACGKDMLLYMMEADKRGFNILTIDARACGASEGRFSGLGWLEHYDLISWCTYLVGRDRDAKIALYGVSLGANAVMNAVGDYLPENVVAAVEDSGYLSIWDTLAYQAEKRAKCPVCAKDAKFKIPMNCFKSGVDFYVKQWLHFSLDDCNTAYQLNQAKVPMLFIHGIQDEEVKSKHVYECYNACASEKKLMVVQGLGHLQSCLDEHYFDDVFTFINSYM